MLQAIGAAAIEALMDDTELEIRRELADGETLVSRYSPGYGDYPQMKEALKARRQLLQKDYIQPMVEDSSLELQEQLWTKYRGSYERFMSSAGPARNRPEAGDRQLQSGR